MSAVLTDAFCTGKSAPQLDDGLLCVRMRVCEENAATAALTALSDDICLPFDEDAMRLGCKNLFLPSLDIPDKTLDSLIEYALENGARVTAVCSATLEEAGIIDSRFGKSPVMLLHECGLLVGCTVVGGVYLDKDDLALMAQENVPLVVRPSFDAGYGHGVAPVIAALKAGVKVSLGTADGVYNKDHSVLAEAAYLRLLTAAQLNRRDALSLGALSIMAAGEENEEVIKRIVCR
ncbi:MAG: hypothetical protein K2M95_07220 [Clostridiales bacterium]|nr:hypothetical protein [Clostridiales bacterium]